MGKITSDLWKVCLRADPPLQENRRKSLQHVLNLRKVSLNIEKFTWRHDNIVSDKYSLKNKMLNNWSLNLYVHIQGVPQKNVKVFAWSLWLILVGSSPELLGAVFGTSCLVINQYYLKNNKEHENFEFLYLLFSWKSKMFCDKNLNLNIKKNYLQFLS